jgi:hypothetical protein
MTFALMLVSRPREVVPLLDFVVMALNAVARQPELLSVPHHLDLLLHLAHQTSVEKGAENFNFVSLPDFWGPQFRQVWSRKLGLLVVCVLILQGCCFSEDTASDL